MKILAGVLILFLAIMFASNSIHAETRTVEADGYYTCNVERRKILKLRRYMTAIVDPAIASARAKDRQRFNETMRRQRELERENERLNRELAQMKSRYEFADEEERQRIRLEIKINEEQFTAVQWNRRGLDEYNWKHYRESIHCYQQAIALDSSYAAPWNNLGFAYKRLFQSRN